MAILRSKPEFGLGRKRKLQHGASVSPSKALEDVLAGLGLDQPATAVRMDAKEVSCAASVATGGYDEAEGLHRPSNHKLECDPTGGA